MKQFFLPRSRLVMAGAIVALPLLTLIVYLPGIQGPFLLDDLVNLQALGTGDGVTDLHTAVDYIFGNRSGPAGRPVSMASFLLDARDWPAEAASFKSTNLVLHILNGLLIAYLSLVLFRTLHLPESRAKISAIAVSAIWLLHPLNVSTTLYVVQRMTQLMTLFSLAGLICYVKGRAVISERPQQGLVLMTFSLLPFGLLALLSKENGALLLVALLTLEYTLLNRLPRNGWQRGWFAAGVLLPVLGMAVYLVGNFSSQTAAYQYREFSLSQRLLTEGRIVIDYLSNLLLPRIGEFSLHHDDVTISTGLLHPVSTLVCLVLILGLVVTGFLVRRNQPVISFAIFWYLGWHLLESTFLPLELYFEHRNYLPIIGPLIALVYYFGAWAARVTPVSGKRMVPVAGVLVTLALALATLQLTSLWGNNLALAAHWAERHPASYRAQVEYAYLQAETGSRQSAYDRILTLQQRYPDEVALQLLRWNFACSLGLPAPYPLNEIASSRGGVYYRADLTTELQTLLNNLIADRCEYPAPEVVENLFVRLADVPMRVYESSGFHLLFSDFYVHFRELNSALVQLRIAFELRPDAAFPIRQAILSASAGNYADSLVFLQRAREADENRAMYAPSRIDEIEEMEQELKVRLGTD